MKISFKQQSDNIEKHVKQVMRENYASMENEILNHISKNIEDKYRSEFQFKLKKVENELSNKDLISILKTLKSSYEEAGLVNDYKVLEKQIAKLDVQA